MTGPRDPFAVDADKALEALEQAHGDRFAIWHDTKTGLWHARRHGKPALLTGKTPDELVRAMGGTP